MTMHCRSRLQEARLALLVGLALSIAGCTTLRTGVDRVHTYVDRVSGTALQSADQRSGWTSYTVRRGDTLGRIAACHGTSVSALAKANGIADPRRLRAGQNLQVARVNRCPTQAIVERGQAAKPVPATAVARPADDAADVERSRQLLDEARARYDAADFEAALRGADAAARALDSDRDTQRARCHMLAALAATGLEDRERAISEMRVAFTLDPEVVPAPEDRSPRIDELIAAARESPAKATPGDFVENPGR
jgi:LysM repeat protein